MIVDVRGLLKCNETSQNILVLGEPSFLSHAEWLVMRRRLDVLTPQRVVHSATRAIWIVHPFEFFSLWMEQMYQIGAIQGVDAIAVDDLHWRRYGPRRDRFLLFNDHIPRRTAPREPHSHDI